MQLGEKQVLKVVKQVDFGVYLGDGEEKVLLPKKQVPEGTALGDEIEVFLYKDSSDRPIATTKEPYIQLGGLAVLEVLQVGKFGAFLDWGLEKDLFLPFREQTAQIRPGDRCLVTLYIDKSQRLCASMKVYGKLRTDSPYQKDDRVKGIVYEKSDNFGVFVAVDNQYSALIPRREVSRDLKVGDRIEARVTDVKEDGKLNLSAKKKAYLQMDEGKLDLSIREKAFIQIEKDAAMILQSMEERGGELPFSDKADAELIKKEFGISKAAFKRAVGHLYKERKIEILPGSLKIRE